MPALLEMTEKVFVHEGIIISNKLCDIHCKTDLRRFVALFGVSSSSATILWNRLGNCPINGGAPKHLLWALMFVKIYATENVNATLLKTDEKTFRKWTWVFLKMLSDIKVVSNLNIFYFKFLYVRHLFNR